jgi:hypothetical protein
MVKKTTSFLLIDAQIPLNDQAQISYLQDSFLLDVRGFAPPVPCEGPIEAQRCAWCGAPTTSTPHPDRRDLLPYSSSFEFLFDLFLHLLQTWSLQEIRLFSKIARPDEPLQGAQDLIHVFQKRHPLGLRSARSALEADIFWYVEEDFIQPLAPDVYFIPLHRTGPVESEKKYKAHLLIGRVLAHFSLSKQVLLLGKEEFQEQWVTFLPEAVPSVLAEHPTWQKDWQAAWQTFLQAMQREDTEAAQALLDHPFDWKEVQALLQHDTPMHSLRQPPSVPNVFTSFWRQARHWLGQNSRQQ